MATDSSSPSSVAGAPAASRLRLRRPALDAKKNAGLAVLGLVVLVVGLGSWAALVVWVPLAWLWWGRPLGMAALFAVALSIAAYVNQHRPKPEPARAAAARSSSA